MAMTMGTTTTATAMATIDFFLAVKMLEGNLRLLRPRASSQKHVTAAVSACTASTVCIRSPRSDMVALLFIRTGGRLCGWGSCG